MSMEQNGHLFLPSKANAGALLKRFREDRKIGIIELAAHLGVSRHTLYYIEAGRNTLAAQYIEGISNKLGLNVAEKNELITLALPYWKQANDLKALDNQWLRKQPLSMQAGLLLRALRVQKDLSCQAIADKMDVCEETIRRWERSETIIQPQAIETLQTILGFNEATKQKLKKLTLPYYMQPNRTAEKFTEIIEPKHNGEYLRTLRHQKGVDARSFARMMSIEPETLAGWEQGNKPVPECRVEQIIDKLKLNTTERHKLLTLSPQKPNIDPVDAQDPHPKAATRRLWCDVLSNEPVNRQSR